MIWHHNTSGGKLFNTARLNDGEEALAFISNMQLSLKIKLLN